MPELGVGNFFSNYVSMRTHRLANITQAIAVESYKFDIVQDTTFLSHRMCRNQLGTDLKLHPYCRNFIVFEDTIHDTGGEKPLLIMATYSPCVL